MIKLFKLVVIKTTAAIVWQADKPLTLHKVALDGLKDNDVLIELKATGICHTDGLLSRKY